MLVATLNFIFQVTILLLLFFGVWLKSRKKFRQHGIATLIAVVLHTIAIFAYDTCIRCHIFRRFSSGYFDDNHYTWNIGLNS
jgi:uncharacterized membrane protein YozB (DUF420 family)